MYLLKGLDTSGLQNFYAVDFDCTPIEETHAMEEFTI